MGASTYFKVAGLGLAAVALHGCTPLIAGYSLESYGNATRLKAETLTVIDEAVEPYPAHAVEVRKLQTDLNAAYEYSHGLARNEQASEMWAIIRNPATTGSLLGEFLDRWRAKRTPAGDPAGLSRAYASGKATNVAFAFDRLICLESNKKQATKCPDYPGSRPAAAPPPPTDAKPSQSTDDVQ